MTQQLRFLLLSGTLAALTPAAQAETLREAMRAAYDSNPTLTAAREGQKANNENVPIAKASGRPNAQLQPTFTENLATTGAFAQARSFDTTGNVSVPLYQGGGVKNAVKAAKTRVQAGLANLRGIESALFSQVVGAYMDVIRDEAVVGLNRAQVGVLSVNFQATQDRFQIGDLTRTDVAQSEARLAQATSGLESARANLIRAKEIYLQLVGREPVNLKAPPPLPGLPKTPDMAVDVALSHNPDLIAAREARDAARYDRKAANASRLPTLDAFGNASYRNALGSLTAAASAFSPNGAFTSAVGVRATIPIYQGGRPAAQIRQAQAQLGQAIEQEIGAERNIIAQTRAAYASWQASLQVIESSQRAVSANELSLEGVRAENTVGNRTILDILNAEQELLNSKVNLVTARRNAYVAGFTLLAAMGKAEARDLGLDSGPLYDPVADYDKVKNKFNDWSNQRDPEAKATRTIDSPAQKADIEALPNTVSGNQGKIEP